MLSSNDIVLLRFLYRRSNGQIWAGTSASHADELNHIPSLSVCWRNLRDHGLVVDDVLGEHGVDWKINQAGRKYVEAEDK